MKIINKTKWSTRDLQAFFRRAAQEEMDPPHFKRLRATIVYTRGGPHRGYSTGYAYYNSATMTLRVSAHQIDRVDMAMIIAHEMAHCRGLHHRDMNTPRYRRIGNWRERYAWADQLPLRDMTILKKKVRVVGAEADAVKLSAAQGKVAEWDRKIKAASTRRHGWVRKVKYYERKLAKAAARRPAD